ncbi:hypothetical protein Y032_0360g3435 [Ancylostoma ceylanicum]|uniref:Alpha-ketoglutarate-dependent dioxygenase AlkB-like domain-containing protein n=1 Tax=Ancylostoma ceylanicum TaxID=53326 RepID=A0A016RVP2_9BILA|nr:hypothetical protein Y032_0360g3435 [Ancylostoma ceylanicum]
MLSRITGSLCRNTSKSLIEVKSSCCANTRRFTMNGAQREVLKTNSDSHESVSPNKKFKGDHYGSDSEEQPTVFKKMFKMYKRRNPAPDLSQLIDPRVEGKCGILNFQQLSSANVNEDELLQLGLKPLKNWKLVTLSGRQGLYIIPNAMREEAVEMWLSRSFKYAEPPNTTNLTAHGKSPEKDVLKIAGKSLRWTTLGVDYNWDTKEYPLTGDPLPPELVQFADVVTRVLGLGPMYADATIVNYYPPKSTLSPHVDRSVLLLHLLFRALLHTVSRRRRRLSYNVC